MKQHEELLISGLSLNRDKQAPLYRQLYDQIRTKILQKQLQPGQRLPSTRELATLASVSRNTAVLAYECLTAEGYIENTVGSGSYVSSQLSSVKDSELQRKKREKRIPLSESSSDFADPVPPLLPSEFPPRPFAPGIPHPGDFPESTWRRLYSRQLARSDLRVHYPEAGYPPLKKLLKDYVRVSRGIHCTSDQVFIVSGGQQAFALIARLCFDRGDTVLIEDPGYPGARSAFKSAGAVLQPRPIDDQGIVIADVPPARMIYVTPSYQYPTGTVMSLERRLELLSWARSHQAWIIEDDYDNEMRYSGYPQSSLFGLDDTGLVIYVGTFSKTLMPALRLGYMVVPQHLVQIVQNAQRSLGMRVDLIYQATLAAFFSEGHYGRQVRRMRKRNQERQKSLIEAVREFWPDWITINEAKTGMHLVACLPDNADDSALSDELRSAGIIAFALSHYSMGSIGRRGLILGYSAFDEEVLRQACKRAAPCLEATTPGRQQSN